jgi:hypothetical protein
MFQFFKRQTKNGGPAHTVANTQESTADKHGVGLTAVKFKQNKLYIPALISSFHGHNAGSPDDRYLNCCLCVILFVFNYAVSIKTIQHRR